MLGLADTRRIQGRYHDADEAYRHALAIATTLGDRLSEAHSLRGLADSSRAHGSFDEADEAHDRAWAIAVDLGDRLGEAYTLRGLADIVRQKGRTDEASAAYRRAAALFRQLTMSSEANEIEERITSLEPAPAVPLAD